MATRRLRILAAPVRSTLGDYKDNNGARGDVKDNPGGVATLAVAAPSTTVPMGSNGRPANPSFTAEDRMFGFGHFFEKEDRDAPDTMDKTVPVHTSVPRVYDMQSVTHELRAQGVATDANVFVIGYQTNFDVGTFMLDQFTRVFTSEGRIEPGSEFMETFIKHQLTPLLKFLAPAFARVIPKEGIKVLKEQTRYAHWPPTASSMIFEADERREVHGKSAIKRRSLTYSEEALLEAVRASGPTIDADNRTIENLIQSHPTNLETSIGILSENVVLCLEVIRALSSPTKDGRISDELSVAITLRCVLRELIRQRRRAGSKLHFATPVPIGHRPFGSLATLGIGLYMIAPESNSGDVVIVHHQDWACSFSDWILSMIHLRCLLHQQGAKRSILIFREPEGVRRFTDARNVTEWKSMPKARRIKFETDGTVALLRCLGLEPGVDPATIIHNIFESRDLPKIPLTATYINSATPVRNAFKTIHTKNVKGITHYRITFDFSASKKADAFAFRFADYAIDTAMVFDFAGRAWQHPRSRVFPLHGIVDMANVPRFVHALDRKPQPAKDATPATNANEQLQDREPNKHWICKGMMNEFRMAELEAMLDQSVYRDDEYLLRFVPTFPECVFAKDIMLAMHRKANTSRIPSMKLHLITNAHDPVMQFALEGVVNSGQVFVRYQHETNWFETQFTETTDSLYFQKFQGSVLKYPRLTSYVDDVDMVYLGGPGPTSPAHLQRFQILFNQYYERRRKSSGLENKPVILFTFTRARRDNVPMEGKDAMFPGDVIALSRIGQGKAPLGLNDEFYTKEMTHSAKTGKLAAHPSSLTYFCEFVGKDHPEAFGPIAKPGDRVFVLTFPVDANNRQLTLVAFVIGYSLTDRGGYFKYMPLADETIQKKVRDSKDEQHVQSCLLLDWAAHSLQDARERLDARSAMASQSNKNKSGDSSDSRQMLPNSEEFERYQKRFADSWKHVDTSSTPSGGASGGSGANSGYPMKR